MLKPGMCKKITFYATIALTVSAAYYYYQKGSFARPSEMVSTTVKDAKKAAGSK